jgi:peptidylamidoglycolate lyase
VGLHQVFKFSHDGQPILAIGEARVGKWDATHFNQPTDVAIRPDGSFYVSDGYVNSRVALFDRTDGALYVGIRWADYDARHTVFNAVHDLAVGRDGSIYVAETRTTRVVKLRPVTGP